MKVTRRRGVIRLQLEPIESELLDGLLDDLDTALGSLSDDDPVRQRLFPAAYRDDPQAADEFRSLTESSLREARSERIGACRTELPAQGGTLALAGDDAERWLTVLNDVRLGIGTRLDVREDEYPVVDPADPQAQARAIYHWLTVLQDSLVHAAMR